MKMIRTLLPVILIIPIFTFLNCSGGSNSGNNKVCNESGGTSPNDNCWFSNFSLEGSGYAYPNPVANGNTLNLKVKMGAVNVQQQFLDVNVYIKVYSSSTGQLVTSFLAGTFPPSPLVQTIPIWANINVSAGTYVLEITLDFGDCGKEIVCLTGKKRITVVN